MFPFKKPPSRAEVARETVVNAAGDALDSLSHHAHDFLENAYDLIEGTLERAHDKLEIVGEVVGNKIENAVEAAPLDKVKSVAADAATSGASVIAGAAGKLGALGTSAAASAAAGAALAGKNVADKVGGTIVAARETAPQDAPNAKHARKQAQSEINNMNKEAVKYKRELEEELARDQKLFAAEQARMQREYDQMQAELEAARQQADDERATLSKRQRKFDKKNDIVRVPIAPTDEVVVVDGDDDGDYEYRDADYDYDYEPKSSGGNTWLLLGGALLVGAGAIYYLFSSTNGKRKRAVIQDRVGQVADGVREKVTQNSDKTGQAQVEEIAEAATGAFDRSNEKIADDENFVGNIDAKLPPTKSSATAKSEPGLPDKAMDVIEEVSDKVADGIAGAGAFLANKLEAAGAGAKSAAHSAAGKLDDAREKTVAKIDEARKPTPNQAPNAVVVEVITDEPPKGQTSDEILAEVEQTVRNIENSAREGKN